MSRPRIKTVEVNGKRVRVVDKVFDCGLLRKTIHNVYKVTTSGTPESIQKYIKSQRYARERWSKANRHQREINALRVAM